MRRVSSRASKYGVVQESGLGALCSHTEYAIVAVRFPHSTFLARLVQSSIFTRYRTEQNRMKWIGVQARLVFHNLTATWV
jgi:hypothetical protein